MGLISCLQTVWDFIHFFLLTIYVYSVTLFRVFFPPPLKSLEGETILLTGSAGGIGREICLQLVGSGATLICWDINKRENDLMVKELRTAGLKAFGFTVDVSDRIAVEGAVAKIQREFGTVDIIINNAGIFPCHPFLSHNPREITRCFEVNVFSQFWILREFLPRMIESGKGQIVTLCSGPGMGPCRNMAPYSAATQAVEGFINSLKYEIKFLPDKPKPDIKFTTVYTGYCRTGLLRNVQEFTRFPFLFPIIEPDFAARKIIEGFRRNYERVYVPGALSFLINNMRTLQPKLVFAATDLIKYYVEPESEERK